MNDTIRWCFTHKAQQAIVGACDKCFNSGGYMHLPSDGDKDCDIADALVIRAPVDYEAGIEAFQEAWNKAEIGGTEDGFAVAFGIGVDAAVEEDET